MKALSIQQPWASLILTGVKSVENRTWKTPHRGPLLIHAGKTMDLIGLDHWPHGLSSMAAAKNGFALAGKTGLILGMVELVDCVPIQECQLDWACGPWCWLLREPRIFRRPIAYRGQLHLFDVPDESIADADPIPPHQWLTEHHAEQHAIAFGQYLRTTHGATTANE